MSHGPGEQRPHKENYGRGQVELSDDELAEIEAPDFKAELTRLFASPTYQPPALPMVALKVVELSRKPKVEFDEVTKVLEQDPMLVAKVMQRVQSPLYAGASPPRAIKQAVLRLGIGGLRDLVLEVAMNLRIFRAGEYARPMDLLRRHSLMVAHCARVVCRYATVEADYAFLCGLLHDVGIAAALIALGDGAIKVKPDPIILWKAIDETHEEASGLVAGLWKLPEEIKLVLAHHHRLTIGGFAHPMIAVLTVAHAHATSRGFGLEKVEQGGHSRADTFDPALLPKALASLRLGDQQQKCIERDLAPLEQSLQSGL
jgi:HD-like signal output (HDOD) protein